MIVVDLETSGLDERKHSILSIGALEYDNPDNTFYGECKPREDAIIDETAIRINGFTQDKINRINKTCKELLVEFLEWSKTIKDKTLGGHNPHFDYGFLIGHLKYYNLDIPFKHRLVDLHSIFYCYCLKNKIEIPIREESSGLDLDFILKTLNLPIREDYHNALEDARLTSQAFHILMK